MRIEILYTYNERDQEIRTYPFVNPILKDKETLFEFVTEELNEEEINDLVKLSVCIYINGGNIEEPHWFIECNGKLWIENGKIKM